MAHRLNYLTPNAVILTILFGFLISLPVALLVKQKAHREGLAQGREEGKTLAVAKAEAERIEAYHKGFQSGREAADSEYVVQITPVYRKSKAGLVGYKKYVYEFGYDYQLFLKGLPCLVPVEHIVERVTETEIDSEDLERRVNGIVQAAVSGFAGNVKLLTPRQKA